MVTTAFINIYGKRVGAVAWDSRRNIASFEYDPKFKIEQLPIAPIKMPTKNKIYNFPEFVDSETFRGLPGLLADALPDRYGKDLINAWLARQGRPDNSLNLLNCCVLSENVEWELWNLNLLLEKNPLLMI